MCLRKRLTGLVRYESRRGCLGSADWLLAGSVLASSLAEGRLADGWPVAGSRAGAARRLRRSTRQAMNPASSTASAISR